MTKPIDWNLLRHVIEQGSAEACRDAGLETFGVRVLVIQENDIPVITVGIIPVTEEQIAELTGGPAKGTN